MESITFKTLCMEWIAKKKLYVKESTYATYYSHLENHIVTALGNLQCSELTEADIEIAVREWSSCLSEKSVKDIIIVLRACMKYGYKCGYINFENLEFDYLPKRTSQKIKTYSPREQKIIVTAVLTHLNYKSLGILLTLYTGIRIGELCALKWCDIDFKNKTIIISKTLQRLYFKDNEGKGYTKICITEPKTFSSQREIPFSSSIMKILESMRPNSGNTYLLTGDNKFIEPRTYRNYYNKFIENLNIRPLNFHSLRHTFATSCIESGADYKTVSELLGHSTVNMTLNLYVHPSMEQKRKCVELMEQGF